MKTAHGFTLIELMITTAVLSILVITLYGLGAVMATTTAQQHEFANLRDEGRFALNYMARHIRVATEDSLSTRDEAGNIVPLPETVTTNLRLQEITDLDGNGIPLDANYNLERTPFFTFGVDFNDANRDGVSATQLVRLAADGTVDRVIASNLAPNGLSFQRVPSGIEITLSLTVPAVNNKRSASINMSRVVNVRN